MRAAPGTTRADRVELVLQQVETLPTLSPIALRLLRLSSADNADLKEIVTLVEADAALTGRLLSLCRRSVTGLGDAIVTVERAVVMLGFDAVRSALLSVHLHQLVSRDDRGLDEPEQAGGEAPAPIDRRGLWRHSLAVACAAEMITDGHRTPGLGFKPDEAFVAGLLHDLGKYVLDSILPRTYARVARLADRRAEDIADIERQIVGVDHHEAGKRLAERWSLPHALQDVMWLHGQPAATVPDLPHRAMIGVVCVADALARSMHIGWSGNHADHGDLDALCVAWDLDPQRVRRVEPRLIDRVADRAQALGIDDAGNDALALEAVLAANRRLGALNSTLRERTKLTDQHVSALEAVIRFNRVNGPRSLVSAFADVAASAASVFGEGFYAVLYQSRAGLPWHVCQCAGDGRVVRSEVVGPPPGGSDLASLADPGQLSAAAMGMVSFLTDYFGDSSDLRRVRLLPLVAGSSRPAFLVHDRPIDAGTLRGPALQALTSTWAAAIASAAQHDGARRLGEQLADANRRVVQAQKSLAEVESMLRLGELAAGLAHEMNNPLTVVRGRCQLLARGARNDAEREAAQAVADAAERLSDLVTSLHFFARPPEAKPDIVDLPDLLARVVRDSKLARAGGGVGSTGVRLVVQGPIPPVWVDPGHLSAIMGELLQNAWEARPSGFIEVRAHIDGADDRLILTVRDDGAGMSEHALKHAFDPFFSEKQAGRQTGLGLARARRLADLIGGRIELSSRIGEGTTARAVLKRWRREAATKAA